MTTLEDLLGFPTEYEQDGGETAVDNDILVTTIPMLKIAIANETDKLRTIQQTKFATDENNIKKLEADIVRLTEERKKKEADAVEKNKEIAAKAKIDATIKSREQTINTKQSDYDILVAPTRIAAEIAKLENTPNSITKTESLKLLKSNKKIADGKVTILVSNRTSKGKIVQILDVAILGRELEVLKNELDTLTETKNKLPIASIELQIESKRTEIADLRKNSFPSDAEPRSTKIEQDILIQKKVIVKKHMFNIPTILVETSANPIYISSLKDIPDTRKIIGINGFGIEKIINNPERNKGFAHIFFQPNTQYDIFDEHTQRKRFALALFYQLHFLVLYESPATIKPVQFGFNPDNQELRQKAYTDRFNFMLAGLITNETLYIKPSDYYSFVEEKWGKKTWNPAAALDSLPFMIQNDFFRRLILYRAVTFKDFIDYNAHLEISNGSGRSTGSDSSTGSGSSRSRADFEPNGQGEEAGLVLGAVNAEQPVGAAQPAVYGHGSNESDGNESDGNESGGNESDDNGSDGNGSDDNGSDKKCAEPAKAKRGVLQEKISRSHGWSHSNRGVIRQTGLILGQRSRSGVGFHPLPSNTHYEESVP